ncbi:hypothetical protein NFI96_013268 [Prochilodus magdalenae]|nr:hypothetical protein NFI96_013268 [Prochilodus magdalenae]
MSFSGKYQLESQEGFESFMKAIGLPDELIEKGKDIKSTSEIEQNGDHFKVTVTTGSNVLVNSFTCGQESELETLTGEKIKARLRSLWWLSNFLCCSSVVTKEGNKLKVILKGIESITELVDENTLINVSTNRSPDRRQAYRGSL